jgi:cold shock CspA family protein
MADKLTGVIVFIAHSRGFGFVRGEADNQSRFMHVTDVVPQLSFDTMSVGQRVSFHSVDWNKDRGKGNGLRAVNVEVI